jgi:CheY-like chemotaxis protein
MDGIETLHALRGLGCTRPVVALTANAVKGQAEMFREKGFDEFIAKPIDLRQLDAVLNKFVRDPQPPASIEAARRQKNSVLDSAADATPQASVPPHMAKLFVRDAAKAAAVLQGICAHQCRDDDDVHNFVISAHSMKSTLAIIGEPELSAFAARLEQAGRERDAAVISSETPAFLDALRAVIARVTPGEEDDEYGETTDEDRAYLRDRLRVLKAACLAYDKKAARDMLSEIQHKTWPRPTRKLLDTIAEHLLHSKFAGIASLVDELDRP